MNCGATWDARVEGHNPKWTEIGYFISHWKQNLGRTVITPGLNSSKRYLKNNVSNHLQNKTQLNYHQFIKSSEKENKIFVLLGRRDI